MATLAPPPARSRTNDQPSPTEERAARVRYRRAIALLVMSLLVPGSAQLIAGNRRVGRIALWTWVGLIAAMVFSVLLGLVWHGFAFWLATTPWVLLIIRLGLIAAAIAWVGLIVDAWRLGQPLTLRLNHRRVVVALNGVLAFSVAGVLLFGSHLVDAQRQLVQDLFGGSQVVGAHDGRFNILLLGGDAGAGRTGLRPDSMTVASIDADSGRTVLIGLPRNMANFPFEKGSVMAEEFPDGFDCDGCYLNAVSTWAEDHSDLFPKSEHPGIDATISGVEGVTGLKMNYWAMVDLQGFKDLVDAVGGVTLNVRQSIPIGLPTDDFYDHIEPGVRQLNGFETLWFARARHDSNDYSRMARQKCVMTAMLQQISPQTAIKNFSAIAQASGSMVSTNVPASEVSKFIPLALKAKDQKISSVSLVPPLINTADPDMSVVHNTVTEAIDKAEGRVEENDGAEADKGGGEAASAEARKKQAAKQSNELSGGSLGSIQDGYVANDTDDVAAVC